MKPPAAAADAWLKTHVDVAKSWLEGLAHVRWTSRL